VVALIDQVLICVSREIQLRFCWKGRYGRGDEKAFEDCDRTKAEPGIRSYVPDQYISCQVQHAISL
jgi:hypothetical protein